MTSADKFTSSRSAVLDEHDLTNPTQNVGFEELTAFAAGLCEAPICLVSIVGDTTQRFLGKHGLDVGETPREWSFCAHAMLERDLMVVPDATQDPRFANNPLVTGEPHVRFYAGAPLATDDGYPLGSLCVIDSVPRAGLSALQAQGLRVMASQVKAALGSRRRTKLQATSEAEAKQALSETEQKFRILADTMPQMVWSTLPDGHHDYYNARWYEFTGVPEGSTDGEAWNGMFHPEDQDRAWQVWRHSLKTGEPYEIEYRLRDAAGKYRWTLGRALPIRDDQGNITRWFGTCTDIHEQKLLMEQREMVSQELSHRIKNIFSVINGLIGLSTRSHPELKRPADELRARIMSLGRAHDFVRPHSARSQPSTPQAALKGLLEQLFSAYQSEEGRIVIEGGDLRIDDRSATPLALSFHELATNAAKYGALSTIEGRVVIQIREVGDDVAIAWTERGGPKLQRAPTTEGFGSRLINLSLTNQLGGTVRYSWSAEGLEVEIRIPKTSMSRPVPQRT
ncbi:PAS domain-containing protein [Bradyrhizobium sp. BR 10289]|uniref:sensor histidine kinase n=1 Tax=Bradyrhizobium sp. BR 10289 TaxID=2749993 RepID=UPI001C64E733|nr:PAS domain-containing protein [Bradyrhizobium sp. BR 10289]MBW7971831.1 PAS domain-containing protein [Bradyrhizobium sp. BR 10289]